MLFGHVHIARTGGSVLNKLLASRYERVCGHKGYSYDFYQASHRMGSRNDSVAMLRSGFHRERVPWTMMLEIGFEDCDYVSQEDDWSFWLRFRDWPEPLELHVPCREPIDHLMSQCSFAGRHFDCANASRGPASLRYEVDQCKLYWGRFTRRLLHLNNTRTKCFDFRDQFTGYLAHMDTLLQRKRIPATHYQWAARPPRDRGGECIWGASRNLTNQITSYMRRHDYYDFCHSCLRRADKQRVANGSAGGSPLRELPARRNAIAIHATQLPFNAIAPIHAGG